MVIKPASSTKKNVIQERTTHTSVGHIQKETKKKGPHELDKVYIGNSYKLHVHVGIFSIQETTSKRRKENLGGSVVCQDVMYSGRYQKPLSRISNSTPSPFWNTHPPPPVIIQPAIPGPGDKRWRECLSPPMRDPDNEGNND